MGQSESLTTLLTHSLSGKALAVRRVTENTGKRTPGVDGETWKTPNKRQRLCTRFSNGDIILDRCDACTFQRAMAPEAPLDPNYAGQGDASLVLASTRPGS